jgi:hypothetical protein
VVRTTYAPRGQTPVLHEQLTRDHLSAMSGITPEGKLLMIEQEERACSMGRRWSDSSSTPWARFRASSW